MIRFLHTADLQIGKPFHWANDRARSKLRDRRQETLDEINRVADEHEVEFVLIAGDLFDANTVGDDVVTQTCTRLQRFSVPVLILPGNHDFAGGPGCVFRRDSFLRNQPEHVAVLDEAKPYVLLDGQVAILPAPVKRKNEVGDPTAHITGSFGHEEAPSAFRIGLAHGGVVDFSEGDALSRIDPERAHSAELDYLALGDWHGCKKINERTWYAGTPEPDSFQENGQGNILTVEISKRDAVPSVTKVQTSMTDWANYRDDLTTDEDIEALRRWFEELDRPLDTLVRIEMAGVLNFQQMERFEQTIEDLRNTVLHMRMRGEDIQPKASPEEIDSIATDGYLRTAVERLRARSQVGGEEGDIAKHALQQLYRLKHTRS